MSLLSRIKGARNALFAAAPEVQEPPATGGTDNIFSELAFDRILSQLETAIDPDEILQRAGLERVHLRKLMADDEIGGAFETRLEFLLARPSGWKTQNEDLLEVTKKYLAPHEEDFQTSAFSALPFGYSVQECVWRKLEEGPDAGLIVPDRIVEKPFEWFCPTTTNELRYVHSTRPTLGDDDRVDTRFKFFLTRNQPTYRQPYGRALLSSLYWTWFFRTNGLRFWAQYMERSATPWLVGKGATPELLHQALLQAVQDSVIAVPREDEIEVINSSNAGVDHQKFEDAANKRIQKRILGQTGTTEIRPGSGLSASRVMARVLDNKTATDARRVVGTGTNITAAFFVINQFLGEGQTAALFRDDDDCPEYFVQVDDKLEVERSERDARLMAAGVRLAKSYFVRAYDYEEEEIEAIEAATRTPAEPAQPVPLEGEARRFQASVPRRVAQINTDNIEAALEEIGAPFSAEQIIAVIQIAKDEDDLRARFDRMLEAYDPQLTEQFSEALLQADVEGFIDGAESDV